MGSTFLPSLQPLQTYLIPHTNKMKTLLVIAVAVVAAVVVEAAPAPAPAPGHHHRNKQPEEHTCTEVDIQEIFEDGELIDIIEKIIPVACPEHGEHRPSPSHNRHRCDDDEAWDSDEEECVRLRAPWCRNSEGGVETEYEECVDDIF